MEEWASKLVFHACLGCEPVVESHHFAEIGGALRNKSERAASRKLGKGRRHYRSIWRAMKNFRTSTDQPGMSRHFDGLSPC